MTRLRLEFGLAALLLVVGCDAREVTRSIVAPPSARAMPAGPSVLLVTIDTLRADHVGAYGAEFAATPALDALAREGVRFETAISPAPLTLPAHASMLTGLLPSRHGVRHNGVYRLPDEIETMAERFRAGGHSTAAVVGSIVLARRYGLDRGFDVYDEEMEGRHASATGYPERSAQAVTKRALDWLDATPRPFLLWVHYYDPHASYDPPEPFASRFRDRPYDGEIASVDAALGVLIERLRTQGRLDRTLVVVTADHGESLGEHGERTHGYGLYDATLRVPLILRGPGVPAGVRVPGVVSTTSIAPTLLAAAGLPAFAQSDGIDLATVMAGAEASGVAYAETLATRIDHGFAPLFAVRSRDAHFVRAPRPELYDLANDRAQQTNLLESGGDPAANARAAEFDRNLDRVLAHDRESAQIALDASTRAQLESLGYALPAGTRAQSGIDPKDGLPLLDVFERARVAFARGDVASSKALAVSLLEPAGGATSAPLATSPELHELLSRIAFTARDAAAARRHAETAAQLAPENPRVQLLLADAAFELGDVPAALAAWHRADALDGTLAAAKAGLVLEAASRGELAEAERLAAAARALEPASASLEERLATLWDRAGDAERALACARESLRLDRDRPQMHMLAAIQHARLGDAEAADAERRAAGALGDLPPSVNRLAIAFAGAGDAARAESILRALVAAHPEHAPSRLNLARLVRRLGRIAEADAIEAAAPRAGG